MSFLLLILFAKKFLLKMNDSHNLDVLSLDDKMNNVSKVAKGGFRCMDEAKLIEKAKRGDSEALAILLRENYTFLYKYFLKITYDKSLTEDLTQDTMIKCIEKLHLYSDKAKFSTWIISIGTNLYIDQKRKQNRERQYLDQQKVKQLRWETENNNKDWSEALDLIATLKDNVRIPLILKHYYGHTYDEIGVMLNIPAGTVKSRISNGIKLLQEELKKYEQTTKS